jgi:RNA polymerase sigma-70 factor (ECF subfamily)
MSEKNREEIEREARRLASEGDHVGAAEAAIRGLGPEIWSFLMALHRSEQDADAVFSIWSEKLWRGLAGFGWECSLRTWAYAIARNASVSFARGERRRARRELPAQESAALDRVEAALRTETRPYMRTEAKSKLAEIRATLSADDQALLVLRIERRLEWRDLARVLLGEGAPVDDKALTRESQRLRKRFQLLKERLVELGKREGMIGGERE